MLLEVNYHWLCKTHLGKKVEREKLVQHIEKLQKVIEQMKTDKDDVVKEYDVLQIKCKQMKLDHDELREVRTHF